MDKIIFYLTTTIIGLISIPSLAQKTNPLVGRWRWDSPDCTKPDFIFSETKFIHSTEADGKPIKSQFNKIKYEIFENKIIVDLNKPHGFGKTPEKTKLTFKVVDKDHLVIDRKSKSMNDIFRCP